MNKFDKIVNTLLEVYSGDRDWDFSYLDVGHNSRSDAWGFKYNSDDIVYASKLRVNPDEFHGNKNDWKRPSGRIDHGSKTISIAYINKSDENDVKLATRILKMDYPDYKIKLFNT